MRFAYNTVLSQCEQPLRDKLEADPQWATFDGSDDLVGLLNLIQRCMHGRETIRNPTHTMMDADEKFLTYYLVSGVSDSTYLHKFQAKWNKCLLERSMLGLHQDRIQDHINANAADPAAPTDAETKAAQNAVREEYKAVHFIMYSEKKVTYNYKRKCGTRSL
jgi:hypothetical protein